MTENKTEQSSNDDTQNEQEEKKQPGIIATTAATALTLGVLLFTINEYLEPESNGIIEQYDDSLRPEGMPKETHTITADFTRAYNGPSDTAGTVFKFDKGDCVYVIPNSTSDAFSQVSRWNTDGAVETVYVQNNRLRPLNGQPCGMK